MYVYYNKGGKKFYYENNVKCGKVIIKNTQQFTNKKETSDWSENAIFYGTECITTLENDFSKLKNGVHFFFNCINLKTVNADLSSLVDGTSMFYNCTNIETFSGDLSGLTNGFRMFYNCTKLTSFNSNLSSLENGKEMFEGCNLNLESIANIAETIKDYSGESIKESEKPIIRIGSLKEPPGVTDSWMYSRRYATRAIKKKNWNTVVDYGTAAL